MNDEAARPRPRAEQSRRGIHSSAGRAGSAARRRAPEEGWRLTLEEGAAGSAHAEGRSPCPQAGSGGSRAGAAGSRGPCQTVCSWQCGWRGRRGNGDAADAEPHPSAPPAAPLRFCGRDRVGYVVLHLPASAGATGQPGHECQLPAVSAELLHANVGFVCAHQARQRAAERGKQPQSDGGGSSPDPA